MVEEDTTIQSRKWTATLWLHQAHSCLEETMRNLTDTGRVRFIAFGEEVCPDTGTLHYQVYLVCYKPTRLSQLLRWFGTGHHFEPMYGTLKQNEKYCSKEGSFTKLGDEPKQGERHDIIGFKRELDLGRSTDDIAEDEGHFGAYCKYNKAFDRYENHLKKKKRMDAGFRPIKVYILIGEPASGKSSYIHERHGFHNVYTWESDMGSFFDGYSGQSVVHFEDVEKGHLPPIGKFKRLLDGYPVRVNVKGGSAIWSPDYIYISSNHKPCTWYDYADGDYEAVMSRVFEGLIIYKDRPAEVFHKSTRYDAYFQAQEEHEQGSDEEAPGLRPVSPT